MFDLWCKMIGKNLLSIETFARLSQGLKIFMKVIFLMIIVIICMIVFMNIIMFLAALAALYLTLVSEWVG